MKRGFVFLSCLAVISFEGCATHSASKILTEKRTREQGARAAALQWLQLVDAGDYAQAHEEEPARLRTSTTETQFVRSLEKRRTPFGRVLSRKFIGAAVTRKLTGWPDGRHERILFRTSFEHKALAAERVTLVHESHEWRVADYRVY